ncbi:MAG: phosphoenolpyruvate--protein phosphotransferase [Clostridia bacterium]|nr:phosphoenolpyruvate--protein phosphotransferase [Clostridia bacterium]NDO19781.1 phosphoenolpyruvate--protein phosphotransferase [Lachnospiraceae bacterium MD329]
MTEYNGKSVYGGIAIGKIHIMAKSEQRIVRHKIDDCNDEISRFEKAKTEAQSQLAALYDKAKKEVGEASAAIFEIHQMMLDDDDYLNSIKNIIAEQGVNAEYAVGITADNFSEMFSSMDDAYMKERAADVKDISERIIRILTNSDAGKAMSNEPVIILADDLAPSETVQLDKNLVLSFVTVHGSTNSHTAILARTMNIPALIGVNIEISDELEGKMAVVDGFNGVIYIEPDEELLAKMQRRKSDELEKQRLLQELRGKENITKDGKEVLVYANIGNVKDLAYVLKNDAGGIGLFRSEFIYLESSTYPTEDEQFQIYKKAAETMAGKRVIIRTLDIGADKQADYFNLDKEENPAMGLRAIRICLTRTDIFKTQLRAIYRASKYGKLAVMYPMITSVEEVKRIKAISAEVKAELDEENIPYNNIEEGIMIETPAAVMISDMLAKEVDFFSIGTNDLSQYTMAIDRQNPKLDDFLNPHHEAVLRMIEMVCKNAHKENVWVGICGELGADLELTERFLKMGVDELSVSPSYVLPLRNKIRNLDLSK